MSVIPPATPPAGPSGKKLKLFYILLAIVAALYTIGWFYLANKVETRAAHDLKALTQKGINVQCENLKTSGFPLKLDVVCESISWQQKSEAISFSAGHFSSGSAIYAPLSLNNQLTGPAFITFPGLQPLEINWSSFSSNTRLAQPFPTKISVKSFDLEVGLRTEPTASELLSKLEELEIKLSNVDNNFNLDSRFAGLEFAPQLTNRNKMPAIDGLLNITLFNAKNLIDNRNQPLTESLRGQSGEIKQVLISLSNGAIISLSGPFSIDYDGEINGHIKIALTNPPALAQAAQALFPQESNNITTLLFAISAMPKDENGNPTLDVTIKDGKANAGFIPLGRLPPL
ncbi:DUF2125 domain-containing protein [Paenochrobactrum sp. BZR 588]|uniref:DUF2125 domain-containing protein n=1 Tax=unclassified Paenochrobactrum TaxID=2639760 RepID=UPI0038523FF9